MATHQINMCNQLYTKCRNTRCTNLVDILELEECPNRPNCELSWVRVNLSRQSERQHCHDCEGITPRERAVALVRERRQLARRQTQPAQGESGSQIRAAQNVPQHEEATAPAEHGSAEDEDDDEIINAAQAIVALSQEQMVPNLPQNNYERNIVQGRERRQQRARTEHPPYWLVGNEFEETNAARSLLTLSQRIQPVPNLPSTQIERAPATATFVQSQSAQDEDEARDAASILRSMSQGNGHAP